MRATHWKLAVSTLSLAVQGALMAVSAPAMAQDEEDVAALINPTNSVEVGVSGTSKKSAKFGEYNGLNKSGAKLIGNVDVKGGDAFGKQTGTTHWSIYGNDLGTDSRQLGATYTNQGRWNIGIDFDQLRHNISDDYRTPFQGSMGGDSFRLPDSFGTIHSSSAHQTEQKALTATQLGAFHQVDVYSERKNTTFSAGYDFDRHWGVKFGYKRIDQSGAKLTGSGTDAGSLGGYAFSGERIAVLMAPTNFKTDNFNLALNWVGEKGYFTADYYGSLFHDNNKGFSWNNPWTNSAPGGTLTTLPVDTMSTLPSNQFHQFSFTGGYHFSPATHLAGGLSYARNTQNESYDGTYTPGTAPVLPVNSLNGKVITTHADLKLTHRATNALTLNAGLKYNKRDNRTASNQYQFLDLGGTPLDVVNAPMSHKRTQLELSGDYRIDHRQNLRATYEYDKIKRWCNNSIANTFQGAAPNDGSATPVNTSCAEVPESKENRFGLGYRLRANDVVTLRANYVHGKRDATVNPAFYNPMQVQDGGQGYENKGFLAFFDASRKEDLFKAGVNWQATRKLNFMLSGKYAKDDYDTTFGVQKGEMTSLNLDAGYSYSEYSTVAVFVSNQHRTRDMTNGNGRLAGSLATQDWTNSLKDDNVTFGITGKQKHLMHGKLDLSEDLTYSIGKTDYTTGAGTGYTCTVSSSTTTSYGNNTCGSFPTIKSELTSLKLTGGYHIDKASTVIVAYWYQRLKARDPTYYDYFQYGIRYSTLPSYQQAPSYDQDVVFVSYRYSFR